jgi:hypothetical protein
MVVFVYWVYRMFTISAFHRIGRSISGAFFFAVRGLAQIPPAQIGSSCESSVTSARLLRGIGSKLFLLLNLLTYIYNIYIIAEAGAASILLKIIKIGFHDLHQLSTLRLRRLPSWMNLFWNIFTAWAS